MNWKPLSDSHRRRLEFNAHLLQQHRPVLFHTLGNLREHAHHLETIEEDGNLIAVRSTTQDGVRILLPQEQGSILIQQQRAAISAPFERGVRWLVLSGIGAGHSLLIAQSLLEKHPMAGIFAWEPDPYAWTAFLALFDARRIIENTGHFFVFGGKTILDQAGTTISERRLFLFPANKTSYVLGALPVTSHCAESYVEQARLLAQFIDRENAKFEPVFKSFLSQMKDPVNRFPRSVWSCSLRDAYIHFPIAQAFLEGFARLGMQTCLEPLDDHFGRTIEIVGKFFEKKPDMLFSINLWPSALLYDLGLGQEILESIQHPRVCWMVDDTLLYEDEELAIKPNEFDFVFCCDRTYLPRLKELDCASAFLPPATLFNRPGNPREEYRAEISYVGSLPGVQRFLAALSPACREMLERIDTIRSGDARHTFIEILDSLEPDDDQRRSIAEMADAFCKTTNKGFTNRDSILEYFLYNVATYTKRLSTINALLPLGIKVYGPPSWSGVLPPNYSDRYGGFIDRENLADCYASSKICLNIHSHQCPTCLNVRDFDVPMAGSVVLGDYVEDSERGILEPRKEILTYRTLDEAVELTQRYLSDADALDAIRAQGQERVKREHTYTHRARTVLQAMGYVSSVEEKGR